jgi:hypothetical protein
MILYIIILLISLKFEIFNGWLLGLWVTGLVWRIIADFIEIIKFILEIDEEI